MNVQLDPILLYFMACLFAVGAGILYKVFFKIIKKI